MRHDLYYILAYFIREYLPELELASYVDTVTGVNKLFIPPMKIMDNRFTSVVLYMSYDYDNKDLYQFLNFIELTKVQRIKVDIPTIGYSDNNPIDTITTYTIDFGTVEVIDSYFEEELSTSQSNEITVEVNITKIKEVLANG